MDNELSPPILEFWQSESIVHLMGAMNQAQLVMSPAKKDKENPFFKSHYADLSTVWEALLPFREAGIVITQCPMDGRVGHVTLDTQLTHAPTGEWMRSRLVMPMVKQDPQSCGGILTYARRYAVGCMTGLVTEEDKDGNDRSQEAPAVGKTFAEKYPQAVQTVAPAPIVPPGGSQALAGRTLWRVPKLKWTVDDKIAGLTAAELKNDSQLIYFLNWYQKKLTDDPHSQYREREWEPAILDIEEEIALRRASGLVLR